MYTIPKLIVLLLICNTIACHNENLDTGLRQPERRYERFQDTAEITTNIPEAAIIQNIFKVRKSGFLLFNTTYNTYKRKIRESQQNNANQEFKVQRNPDGKLNVVFNDVFFSQKPVTQPSSTNVETTSTHNTYSEKDIFFPDEFGIGPKCKEQGKSFCTDVQNYPVDKLESTLKSELSKFDVLFGDDIIPQPVNISQRMSPGEDSLCNSVERIIYPKAGESKDLKWLYIVNHQNYTQAVKTEECVNPETPCMFAESFPNRYVTKCKQNYIYRQLVALTKNGEIVKEVFKFPSCCKCTFKQV